MITEKIKSSGKLIKVHGIKGELLLAANQELDDELFQTELVFLMIDGLPVPFFITDIVEKSNNTAIIKLEGYDSVNESSKLVGTELFTPIRKNKRKSKLSFNENDLEGYTVIDSELGEIGIVNEVIDYKNNLVIQVFTQQNKEVLIPANNQVVSEIDDEKKIVHISAPEGLIQLYL